MKNFLLILIFISFSLIFADAIYLKNGTKIDGEIIGIAGDSVMIQTNNLETKLVKVGTKDIARIEREKEGRAIVKSVPFSILAAEFGGGLVGGIGAGSVGVMIGVGLAYLFGAKPSNTPGPELFEGDALIITMAIGFGAVGWTLGCASGTCIVGSAYHQNGRFGPTLLGAGAGLLCFGFGAPFGSVIGYNMSRRPTEYSKGPIWNRFDPPAFSFRTQKTKESKIIPVLDFRLVNARF